MSLLNGKTHVAILQIEENPHQTLQELLHMAQNHIAAPIEAAEMTDETCGIAPGKLLLGRAITEQNSSVGNIAVLNLRRTAKRINSGLLKAEIQRAESEFMEQNHVDRISSARRRIIKQDVLNLLESKRTLSVSGIEFAILAEKKIVIVDATSTNSIDILIGCLAKDLGICCKWIMRGINPTLNSRRFFTWLYCQSRESGSITDCITVSVDGPMELVATDDRFDQVERLTKAKIEGAMVTQSDELREMLERHKLLRKAKISININGEIFRFTFNADNFTFSNLELPNDCNVDLLDRINSILQLNTRMNELYRLWETADMNERGEQELPHINGRE